MSTEVPFGQVTTRRVRKMRAEFGKLPERVRTMLAMWRFGRACVSEEEAEARRPTRRQDSRSSLTAGPF